MSIQICFMGIRRSFCALVLLTLSVGGIAAEKYCLKEICVGDPVSNYFDRFKVDQIQFNKNPNPDCSTLNLPNSGFGNSEGDFEYDVSIRANPAKVGRPNGEYYEVVGVAVYFPQVTKIDLVRAAQPVISRYKLKQSNVERIWENREIELNAEHIAWARMNKSALIMSKKNLTPRNAFELQPGCRPSPPKF